VKAVSFVSDGESTCSPYLVKAIKHGKQNGLDMALGTNGYLLDYFKLKEILPSLIYIRFNISAIIDNRYADIHGVPKEYLRKVLNNVSYAVSIKQELNLPVTIGLQMVLLPQYADQIIPLATYGKILGVDYTIIKHCSDDENGSLGVDYSKYFELNSILKKAESLSNPQYQVAVKWSKIMSGGKRSYSRCYGPAFIMQFSGSGLVAPCGMLFNDKYRKYHIGNIAEQSFKEIWKSKRYWDVINELSSDRFDAQTMCGSLCLQHKCNEYLDDVVNGNHLPEPPSGNPPQHRNFV
jgi:MoaA/NifB/PqqE/SkfB family radical SAM enzyme